MHDIRGLASDTVIIVPLISQQHNVDCCYTADHMPLNTGSKWLLIFILLLNSIYKKSNLISQYSGLQQCSLWIELDENCISSETKTRLCMLPLKNDYWLFFLFFSFTAWYALMHSFFHLKFGGGPPTWSLQIAVVTACLGNSAGIYIFILASNDRWGYLNKLCWEIHQESDRPR